MTNPRLATFADHDEIVRIWHEGWADAHTGHVPAGLLPHRQREHFAILAATRIGRTWVAEQHGLVAGFVVVRADEVEQLYVDRSARGSGIAARLLARGTLEIRRAGHPRAWLAVVAGNQRARAFYAREGWKDAGPMEYMADTAGGRFPVPTHRYEIDLALRRA